MARVAETVWLLVEPAFEQHGPALLAEAAAAADTAGARLATVADPAPHAGPLAALGALAGRRLPAGGGPIPLLAADMPNVTPAVLERLCDLVAGAPDALAVVPAHEHSVQPLAAAVRPELFPALQAAFAGGRRGLIAALDELGPAVRRVGPEALRVSAALWDTVFWNLNSPEDWRRWQQSPPPKP